MKFDNPTDPVYFVAQLVENVKAICILANAHQHQRAPFTMAMEFSDFPDADRPQIGQLWSVGHYKWRDGAREKAHLSTEDGLLYEHAVARPGTQKLVRNAEVHTHTATVSRVMSGLEKKSDSRVKVSYERLVEGVSLSKHQFSGLFADFLALKPNDPIPVKMVKLQESCQIDLRHRIVFPNVADREGRALVTSKLKDVLALAKAFSGDYFPLCICGSKKKKEA